MALRWRIAAVGLAAAILGPFEYAAAHSTAPPQRQELATSTAAARKVALGVAILPWTIERFDAFAESVGERPALWAIWNDWGGPNSGFPSALAEQVAARGSVPFIWWQPVGQDPNDGTYRYDRILAGEFDPQIREWARHAKAYGKLLLLRFAHEMEGDWFPWGIGRKGNDADGYIAVWRHVWNIFRGPDGEGAHNVRFVWSPYRPVAKVYPGAQYVDYVGFSAFNWASSHNVGWLSMRAVIAAGVTAGRQFGKPMIVAELGTPVDEQGQTKQEWLRTGYARVYDEFPEVVAITYFNVSPSPVQPDWRLTSPPAGLDAYREIVGRPEFQGSMLPRPPRVTVAVAGRSSQIATVSLELTDPDNAGIDGYYLSEDGTLPPSPAWLLESPTKYALSDGDGEKTIYAWVRNRVGMVSAPGTATTVLDASPPTLTAGGRSPSPTSERSLSFNIVANEPIDCGGITAGDLDLRNGSFAAVVPLSSTSCRVDLTSTVAPESPGTTAVHESSSFSISDEVGNPTTAIAGLPMSWTLHATSIDRTAPSVAAPAATLVTGTQLAGGNVWLRVRWAAGTDDRGVVAYELQFRKGRARWKTVSLASPSALHADVALPSGRSYAFRIRGRDAAGNWSSWATRPKRPLNLYEETARPLKFSRAFRRVAVTGASGGHVRQAAIAGRHLKVRVFGSSIALASVVGPDRGIAAIYLDGVKLADLDLYAASENALVAWSAVISPGLHTLEIRVTGTKRTQSSGAAVAVDAILILD